MSVRCAVEKSGKFLVIRRSQTDRKWPGVWEFPGGKIEENESPLEAAVRETREETGLNVEIVKNFSVHKVYFFENEKIIYYFLARPKTKKVKLSYEHDKFKWLSKNEILKIKELGLYTRYFLEKLLTSF